MIRPLGDPQLGHVSSLAMFPSRVNLLQSGHSKNFASRPRAMRLPLPSCSYLIPGRRRRAHCSILGRSPTRSNGTKDVLSRTAVRKVAALKSTPQELGFFAAAALLNSVAHVAENLLRSRLLLMQPCNSEPRASIPQSLRASFLQSCDTEVLFSGEEAEVAGADAEGGGVCASAYPATTAGAITTSARIFISIPWVERWLRYRSPAGTLKRSSRHDAKRTPSARGPARPAGAASLPWANSAAVNLSAQSSFGPIRGARSPLHAVLSPRKCARYAHASDGQRSR